jgi:TatD DNase family protein
MILTDTHIHLYADEYSDNLDTLIRDAVQKNISRFFIPNVDSTTMDPLFDICRNYKGTCFPMLGLHPCNINAQFREQLAIIKQRAENEKIFAVGEIGIDLYWDKTFRKEQEEAFIIQLQWAKEWNLPVVIHSREATDVIIDLLSANRQLESRGIFHCFSGSSEQAEKIIELGFFLGIGGVLTFKNAGLDKVIADIDISKIVIETDGPYLAPAPYRGKRNDPSFLYLIAEKLAAIKNMTLDEVAAVTTENSLAIFGT